MSIVGSSIKELTVSEGNNKNLYAEQADGYILYPTTESKSLNVVRCSDYTWQIP